MILAIIDSGIDSSELTHCKIVSEISINEDGVVFSDCESKLISEHGTICARIIDRMASINNTNYEICSINIFTESSSSSTVRQLVLALEWCYLHKLPIINICIGTRNLGDLEPVRKWIARLVANGQIIVAAKSNIGQFTIPASINGVLGVEADIALDANVLVVEGGNKILSYPMYIGENKKYAVESNSFAAPVVSALVYSILENQRYHSATMPELIYILSSKQTVFRPIYPDFLFRAILIDFSDTYLEIASLMFECLAVLAQTTEFFYELFNCESVVIIPQRDDDCKLVDYLHGILPPHSSIVYCGCLSDKYNLLRRKRIIWSEDCVRLLPTTNNAIEERPILYIIELNETSNFRIINNLRSELSKIGYECVCVSNLPKAYLYNCYWVRDDTELDNALRYVQSLFEISMVICYVKSRPRQICENSLVIELKTTEKVTEELIQKILEYWSQG